jgi:hypothetical protein
MFNIFFFEVTRTSARVLFTFFIITERVMSFVVDIIKLYYNFTGNTHRKWYFSAFNTLLAKCKQTLLVLLTVGLVIIYIVLWWSLNLVHTASTMFVYICMSSINEDYFYTCNNRYQSWNWFNKLHNFTNFFA